MRDADLQLKNILEEHFNQKRLVNPRYSLRSYARFLKMSPSAVGELMRGKRRASPKLKLRISDRLGLDPALRQKLSELPEKNPSPQYVDLSIDQFSTIAEWQHFAILSLIRTREFKSDPHWIGERLGITKIQAESAVDRLLRLGLLKKNSKGVLKSTGKDYQTTDGILNASLRKSHAANLEIAKNALENIEKDLRDFSAITLTFDPDRMAEARKMLRSFRDQFCLDVEKFKKKEVYKLMIQFVPLTKIKEKKPL